METLQKKLKVRIKIGNAPEIELDAQNTAQEAQLRAVSTELRNHYKAIKAKYELEDTTQILAMIGILMGIENIELKEKMQQQDTEALRILHDMNTALDNYLPK
jgi:cell division protein ZapA (FtsZ GTPase activity inhibitor)